MIFRSAVHELLRSRSRLKSAFFILIVGFLGPLLTSSLQSSVNRYIDVRARQLLSADLAFANSAEFKPIEVELIDRATHAVKVSEATEFVTMAKGRGVSTLIEVQAVDANFPVLGSFEFADRRTVHSAAGLATDDITWVFPEVLAQLGLQVGDALEIGRLRVKIAGVLKDAPGSSRGGVFAPRVFISRDRLARTGLTDLGSQVQYRRYVGLPKGESREAAASAAKAVLENAEITIRTPDDATNSLERFFTFFNVYLVSLSMILFALSWMSAFYILQVELERRLKTSAILLTFGATRAFALASSGVQIFFVLVGSLCAASALVAAALRLAGPFMGPLSPDGFTLIFTFADFFKLLLVAFISVAAFLLPSAFRLRATPLADLLSDSPIARLTRVHAFISYTPLAFIFVGLSIWLMQSLRQALLLTAGLTLAVGLSFVCARLLFRSFFALVQFRPGLPRLIATQLMRARFGTHLCFVTLVTATLVMNLVPHLFRTALKEIEPLNGRSVPALFLFNIPESGLEAVKAFAPAHGAELKFLAPMVFARVQKINGVAPENEMFQKYPVRLTYRAGLIEGERTIAGAMPSQAVAEGQPAAVSIEDGFADRTGLKLGDALEFEVQGVPIEARITSIRKVRWTDLNPNFFMVLQPGAIDDAPKSYLAALYAANGSFSKEKTQYALVREQPNVSVLDVGRTLDKVLDIARSIFRPVQIAAASAVLMSFLVLIGVIAHTLLLRRRELDIQKLLGADTGLIRRLVVGEFVVQALAASLLGAIFAIGLTKLVTALIFDLPMRLDAGALVGSIVVTVLLTATIALYAAGNAFRTRGSRAKL